MSHTNIRVGSFFSLDKYFLRPVLCKRVEGRYSNYAHLVVVKTNYCYVFKEYELEYCGIKFYPKSKSILEILYE